MEESMKELYLRKKEIEEKNLSILLSSLLPDIGKNDPRLAELLSKIDLEKIVMSSSP